MSKKVSAEIGIIGGSGLYDMRELERKMEVKIKTPFGSPSDAFVLGEIKGVKCAFLPRHGRKHTLLPGEIPQRANMYAFKSMGVKRIISASAVGSLKKSLAPAHFFFPDQFVDETRHRISTFFGGGMVGHVPLAEPFCRAMSEFMFNTARKLKIKSHFSGTYVCMEGPQFSTKAESEYHRKMGYSVVGMTMATEAKVAREAGFCYAPVSLVTDYDCWLEGEEVNQNKVTLTMKKNVENVKRLLLKVIPKAGEVECAGHCGDFIKSSLLTNRENAPRGTREKLGLITG